MAAIIKHPSFTDFAKGTVISEADVEIIGARFEMFDYGGKRADAVPACLVTFKTAAGEVHDQGYSVGSAADYAPSKDGKTLDILSDREKIHEQTNFAIFLNAFYKAGFPAVRMNNDDIECIVGTKGHVRQEVVKRTGQNVKQETNILLFDRVTGLPGESKSSGEGATAGADKTVSTLATSIMLEILSDGPIERKALLPKVIKSESYKDKNVTKEAKTAVLSLIKSDDYIVNGSDWSVKDGIVSLGGK